MSKADFDSIYLAPDPRPYFRTLAEFDYQVPDHGARLFRAIGDHLRTSRDHPDVSVADLCCSYGINAALLRHDIVYDDLVAHYVDAAQDHWGVDRLDDHDRDFYGPERTGLSTTIVGLDASAPAIDYATRLGLLDEGSAENLEDDAPSPELTATLGGIDLVTVTGGIGYITDRTMDRVLGSARTEKPWVAALCLRWVDFDPIAAAGASHGLVTERLDDATFPQRRFASVEEQRYVLDVLDSFDVDASGREAEGWHHTDLFVMRPEGETAVPVTDLVAAPDRSGTTP